MRTTADRPIGFFSDLRRRRVLRFAGLYIVGAWVVIEVASVFFPAWGIPDTALRYLFIAAALLFPVAIVFAWVFDITASGIVRTKPAVPGEHVDLSLRRGDYTLLGGLAIIAVVILYGSLQRVADEAFLEPVAEVMDRIENSVAVLPFKNLDPNPDTGYFSDGVSEEILHRLSATRALHVLGWASAKILGQSEVAPAEISERLGVEYLLHGSIRRDGDFVRVTARLMDRTGVQVWSQTFDRKLDAIFVIQSEIASAVSSQIVQEIVSSGGASTIRATDNMDAYNEYLVGRALTHARGESWDVASEAAFRRAIELDPDFAPAYAGLAYSLAIMSPGGRERLDRAIAAARKSVELDPNVALGHAMLGVIQGSMGYTTPVEAEQYLRRALELDPALSDAYNWLFINLRDQGRMAEADAVLEQGYKVDPLAPLASNYANLVLSNKGDYERAMRVLQPFTRLPEIGGPILGALWEVSRDYGRYADAIRWAAYRGGEIPTAYASLALQEQADRALDEGKRSWMEYFYTEQYRDVLRIRGEHERAWAFVQSYIREHGYEFDKLEAGDQGWLVVAQALGRDYRGAVDHFEAINDADPFAGLEEIHGIEVADVINAAGFAYINVGDEEKARTVLSYRPKRLAHFKPWLSPMFLGPMALNAALLGDTDLAYERLSLAVDKGWADYYEAINDPRWGDVLSQPRFVTLLQRVQEDIAAQRSQVEVFLAEDD